MFRFAQAKLGTFGPKGGNWKPPAAQLRRVLSADEPQDTKNQEGLEGGPRAGGRNSTAALETERQNSGAESQLAKVKQTGASKVAASM
jgi:hypothetical protein